MVDKNKKSKNSKSKNTDVKMSLSKFMLTTNIKMNKYQYAFIDRVYYKEVHTSQEWERIILNNDSKEA